MYNTVDCTHLLERYLRIVYDVGSSVMAFTQVLPVFNYFALHR